MMSHRLTAFVAIAALTGAAACSRTEPEQPAAPVEPAAAPASNAPSVGYACESGATLQVQYVDSDNAKLTHQNQTYALLSVQAASGALCRRRGGMVDGDARWARERHAEPTGSGRHERCRGAGALLAADPRR